MASLRYLTVPDVLWINLQVTGASQPYRFDRLEEATFYQYGHGKSLDPVGQAARFLTGFARMRPFDRGNDATAFVALATFLEANGRPLNLTDDEADKWARAVWANPADARREIERAVGGGADEPRDGGLDVSEVATSVMERYRETIRRLAEGESPVPIGR